MHVLIAPVLIRMDKIMSDYAASNIRDDTTDRMIRDFYAREQEFLETCLRQGSFRGFSAPSMWSKRRGLSACS